MVIGRQFKSSKRRRKKKGRRVSMKGIQWVGRLPKEGSTVTIRGQKSQKKKVKRKHGRRRRTPIGSSV